MELDNITEFPVTDTGTPKSYLFYGPPGVGKSYLMCLHPGRGLVLDADQKLLELGILREADRERIKVWIPHEMLGNPEGIEIPWNPDPKNPHKGTIPAQEPQGYKRIVQVTNELLRAAKTGNFPYDWVGHDSLSRTADHWQRLLMYTHKVSFMTERLWGIYLAGLQEYLNGFLQLPCTRIVIAHEKRNVDEDTKIEAIRPSVAGQLGNNLAQYFSEAYYLKGRQSDGSYKLQTVSDYRLVARTSKGLAPEEICSPKVLA
jgi:hypothetical protein